MTNTPLSGEELKAAVAHEIEECINRTLKHGWAASKERAVSAIIALSTRPASSGDGLVDLLAEAYEAGCADTHKAIQADPELALMGLEWCEFGEAASDYAHAALAAHQRGDLA